MTTSTSVNTRPLRLWPGVLLAVLQCVSFLLVPIVLPDYEIFGMLGAVLGGLVILVWWLLFSRAPWSERLGVIGLMIVGLAVTSRLIHISVSGAGMGRLFYILSIPLAAFALVVGVVLGRRLADGPRRAVMALAILLGCGFWTLLRTDGVIGGGGFDFSWRWTPTAEERLLAQASDEPQMPPTPPQAAAPSAPATVEAAKESTPPEPSVVDRPITTTRKAPPEWPGFRGPNRDSIIRGVSIETDWAKSPPVQMWRRAIGPGWSSFAVDGDILYTQEQRGEEELVAAYRVSTGEPVWRHRDTVRFYESNGGAGPRATPMLNNGRVYTLGATGVVNALDAATGKVVWSRNASTDTGAAVPEWGFSASPLIVEDVVIVATSGRLVAYDMRSGKPRWTEKTKGGSYSSPHLVTIAGIPQVLMLNGGGVASVAPASGELLWEHSWPGGAIIQPAIIADGDIVINSIDMMGGLGTRRLIVKQSADGWSVEERWTSKGLKPYYNDFVIHNGHAFGFDGSILACIDLADGNRKWKGGRYGNGQLALLAEQDLLLVLSEEGELALVQATPNQFTELARFTAIHGKTWNHPVLVGSVLLVRNGEEMAAYRLSTAASH